MPSGAEAEEVIGPAFTLRSYYRDGWCIIEAIGDMAVGNQEPSPAAELRRLIAKWFDNTDDSQERRGLIADLSETEYVDTSALGVLVGGKKRARGRNEPMYVVIATGVIAKIFRITNLTRIFSIASTVEEAMADA